MEEISTQAERHDEFKPTPHSRKDSMVESRTQFPKLGKFEQYTEPSFGHFRSASSPIQPKSSLLHLDTIEQGKQRQNGLSETMEIRRPEDIMAAMSEIDHVCFEQAEVYASDRLVGAMLKEQTRKTELVQSLLWQHKFFEQGMGEGAGTAGSGPSSAVDDRFESIGRHKHGMSYSNIMDFLDESAGES
jgi:hypothetical protein